MKFFTAPFEFYNPVLEPVLLGIITGFWTLGALMVVGVLFTGALFILFRLVFLFIEVPLTPKLFVGDYIELLFKLVFIDPVLIVETTG